MKILKQFSVSLLLASAIWPAVGFAQEPRDLRGLNGLNFYDELSPAEITEIMGFQPLSVYNPSAIVADISPLRVQIYADIANNTGGVASTGQRLRVFVDGIQKPDSTGSMLWKISSGRDGHLTSRGTFILDHRHPRHFSSLYNNAPMPYAQFFDGNIAVHETEAEGNLGFRASHGCIRLSHANAELLYKIVNDVLLDDCNRGGLSEKDCPLNYGAYDRNPSKNIGIVVYDSRIEGARVKVPTAPEPVPVEPMLNSPDILAPQEQN
jgi:lipoprotein-anchoring transpeptidase ErfK/SrfK